MHTLLLVYKTIAGIVFIYFGFMAVLILLGKKKTVIGVFYRFSKDKNSYEEDRLAKVLLVVFLIFCVVEFLNFILPGNIPVAAVSMVATVLTCYLAMLRIDRHCRKRRGGSSIDISEGAPIIEENPEGGTEDE